MTVVEGDHRTGLVGDIHHHPLHLGDDRHRETSSKTFLLD